MKHSKTNTESLCLKVYRYTDTLESRLKQKEKKIPAKIITASVSKRRKRTFNDYIPIGSPYVVNLIKYLINTIENKSLTTKEWEHNVSEINHNEIIEKHVPDILAMKEIDAVKVLSKILNRSDNIDISNNLALCYLRNILKSFYPNLIHFLNQDLIPILHTSMYDMTMRPNPQFQDVVRHSMIRCSRTIIDTASFFMIHLFHCWENTKNVIEMKKTISKTYGNLLISFECKPKLIDVNDSTPEECLLGIILETTDIAFWSNLTQNRIFEAFLNLTNYEEKLKRKIPPNNVFHDIPDIMKYDLPVTKIPIEAYFLKANEEQYGNHSSTK